MIRVSLYCQILITAAWSGADGAGFRSTEVQPGSGGGPGFTLMAPQATGVLFTNELQGDLYLTNAVAHNGAGVAIGDVDGDGRPDIYLCNLQGPNRFYRNLGQWRFAEVNLQDAACGEDLSTAAALADVDGDRDLDLLVNGIATGTRLFLNDGKGNWAEVKTSGLSRTASATSLALADIDGDGDLDLYCAHYIDVMHLADPTTRFAVARRGDQWEVTKVNGESARLPKWKDRFEALPGGRVRELPEVHGLYRNEGGGQFTPIQFEPGVFLDANGSPIPPYRDWGLAVMFRDFTGDGAPDLYVCNDFASPDRVWVNTGRGAFRAIAPLTLRHTSRSSMGLDFADLDRDGHDDFIVVDMLGREHRQRMMQLVKDYPDPMVHDRLEEQPSFNRNTLFFGRPDGSFVEAAFRAGVAATDWSWCPIFLDVDLDGYEDLLVSNGFSFDVMDQDSHDQVRQRKLTEQQLKRSRQWYPRWPSPNAAFRNRGDGTFEPMGRQWRFAQPGISYGMALGDLDDDGDLDLVVNNLNDAASLYRNDATNGRIAVRLKGVPPNTGGIGARIRLTGGSISQSQEMIAGGRYMSSDQALRVFAATAPASAGTALRLEVTWRNGEQSTVSDVAPNRVYEVDQAGHRARPTMPARAPSEPYFHDASSLLQHAHLEDSFDDWTRQPLLPRRLSRLGPGVSWYDVNGDSWEDLIITSGRGGKLAVYTNDQGKKFRKLEEGPPAQADQGAVLGWPDGRGNRKVLVAISNYGMSAGAEGQIALHSLTNLAAPQHRPAGKASPGPMALADIDGDGDLDLFVGGRFRPDRYPEPVSSVLWLNEQGELTPNIALSEPFASLGLVSGAAFADLDGDGDPDLALALEWGPLKIFRNDHARLIPWDVPVRSLNALPRRSQAEAGQPSTLNQLTGWWTSIAAGDFDGDGRMDLAAGNWGRNTFYELYQPGPLRVYYDWMQEANIKLIEAWKSGETWLPVRDRTWLSRGLPDLPIRFATHGFFSRATIDTILGAHYQKAKMLEATQLASSIFLNRGSSFERVPLPRAAQLSPLFSLNVGDFDGDGIEDLFLSQNFFGTASDISRDDGGRGLWLQGGGHGDFIARDAAVTGVKLDGEQRGAALADFNHDGRLDLAVSQNNAATRLYLNQGARRGLRVVLRGPASNPDAVGAQMRVRYRNRPAGPARLVQAGAGYWSQDSAGQVLGLAEPPEALWIRWPGGKEQTIALADQQWELELSFENAPK